MFFSYSLTAANAVERDNIGDELVDTAAFASSLLLELGREVVLARWDKTQTVEQTVGIPWLCKIPYLRYLFGTVTRSEEKTFVYMTVTAEMLNTAPSGAYRFAAGELHRVK